LRSSIEAIGVRDSKLARSAILEFTPSKWTAFVECVKAGTSTSSDGATVCGGYGIRSGALSVMLAGDIRSDGDVAA
jgi:hypothetical protein